MENFDIPFRVKSPESDFICKDGEIASARGVNVMSADGFEVLSMEAADESHDTATAAPVPEISFALVRETLPGWHIHPDVYPNKIIPASNPSIEYWTEMGARLLPLFKSEAERQNLFVAPFYAMGAWKSTEGYYLATSTPQLMIPNSEVPVVATDGDLSSSELEMRVAGAVCSLNFKLRAPEILRDWVGKIGSLEILVSSPLQTYDSYHSFVPLRSLTTDSWCESLDKETGIISRKRICTEILKFGWKALTGYSGLNSSGLDGKNMKYFTLASIPLRDVDLLEDWTRVTSGSEWNRGGYSDTFITYKEFGGVPAKSHAGKTATLIGQGGEFEIETRPIKLSSGGRLKRMRKTFLRGDYTPSDILLEVFASRDMLKWWKVAQRKGGTMALLPCSSFRFYKIRVSGRLSESESLQGLTVSGSV